MILCLGTTPAWQRTMVFDRITIDGVNRARGVEEYASGKSINAARVLRTLGQDVLACGFLGGDRGAAMVRDLDRAGIEHHFVAVQSQTRQCMTIIDSAAATATELIEESAPVERSAWELLEGFVREKLPRAMAAVFSGTLPPEAPADFYARFLFDPRPRCPIVLDGRGQPLREALKQRGFVAKLNEQELSDTVGRPLGDERSLRDAMAACTPADGGLIVTQGRRGALLTDGSGWWRLNSPAVKAVNAVGSGDAFAAGLAIGLSLGQSLPQASLLAAACGAANAMTVNAGHIDAAEARRLCAQTRVESLGD